MVRKRQTPMRESRKNLSKVTPDQTTAWSYEWGKPFTTEVARRNQPDYKLDTQGKDTDI